MSVTAVLFLLASALYTGFQWTIRTVVYPQFDQVAPAGFPAYERRHQQRVSRAVGPLFAGLGASALALLADPPAGVSRWVALLAAVLVGGVLAVTALLAVPLHRRLDRGFDPAAHRRLLRVDALRLGLAVAATGVATGIVLR